MIILSVSSSNLSSSSLICADTSGTCFISSEILSSFSRSLIAKNLLCSSAISDPSLPSTAVITSSTSFAKLWTWGVSCFCCASATAFSAAFSIPVPFRAEIGTTSQPSFFPSLSICTLSPLLSTISIILTAMTTGIPSSMICVERYRFLSILVPSTILMIASGLSAIR